MADKGVPDANYLGSFGARRFGRFRGRDADSVARRPVVAMSNLAHNILGAPQRHPAAGALDYPRRRALPSPFDFRGLRAYRAAAPSGCRPVVFAPIVLPLREPAPLYFDPYAFASAADIDAYAIELADLDADRDEDERSAYHAYLDAELTATSGERVLSERWIERPRFYHFCVRCRGDINIGEAHLSQRVAVKGAGQRTDRICDHCAHPKRGDGGSNAERNGTKLFDESDGGSIDRRHGAGARRKVVRG